MDFTKALDITTDKVERPPLPPTGHYVFEVHKQPTMSVVGADDSWDLVTFPMKAVELADVDVDPDELKKFGGVKRVFTAHKFMFDKSGSPDAAANNSRTLFYMTEFMCEHLGVERGLSVRESIDRCVGKRCIADIRHNENKKNPGEYFAEIGRTAPAIV